MFPTIFGLAVRGLGEDTKIASSLQIMAIAGAAVITQLEGFISTRTGSINMAYWVPLLCFVFIAYYGAVACRKDLPSTILVE
jgi:FHS family L-fucose permease-like MFS transporter